METKKLDFLKYKGSLAHVAFDSRLSLGRRFEYDEDLDLYGNIFDPFLLDVEKIRASKSLRRLAFKTQVFPVTKHPNIRNRLIHTNDVVSFCYKAASIMGLNVNLAVAAGMNHDTGHTAYGHLGERVISSIADKKFNHAVMSVVVSQKIERSGSGLNLSYEVLEGTLHHTKGGSAMTINPNISTESSLVMLADKIAYTFSDLNDAIRVGYLKESDVPAKFLKIFGNNQRQRVAQTLFALVQESAEAGRLSFSLSEEANAFISLRDWMYENVYHRLDSEDERNQLVLDFLEIGEFLHNDPFFERFNKYMLLALMTDYEAKKMCLRNRESNFSKLSLKEKTEQFGFLEIASRINHDGYIDIFNPDLNPADFKRM